MMVFLLVPLQRQNGVPSKHTPPMLLATRVARIDHAHVLDIVRITMTCPVVVSVGEGRTLFWSNSPGRNYADESMGIAMRAIPKATLGAVESTMGFGFIGTYLTKIASPCFLVHQSLTGEPGPPVCHSASRLRLILSLYATEEKVHSS